ncbi:MAG: nucleotidyltransferase domain-containing protein [Sedimentisphaerales bacterium]|nr:nucleotidyltransferase domain-containing protein [Sedimentisphaerales bacterium]
MAAQCDPRILNLARRYIQVLQKNGIKPESAWLFGSFARQESDADSDIDIALFFDDVKEKFFKEVELMKFRREVDLRIEPHVISTSETDFSFPQKIIQDGIKIV